MGGRRRLTRGAMAVAVLAALPVLAAPGIAGADGATPVAVSCSGIPILGTQAATATVDATDDVDPVTAGGQVINTLNVPVPVDDVPISVSVKEVKLTVPIPSGVTVTDVTFTASSFPTQTWTISGSNLVATLTGNVPLGGGAPTPTVPDVKVKTTVAGPARTVEWKVPSSITAKADAGGFIGQFTATCTPTDSKQVLITTTVVEPNRAPVATDQSVPVAFETPTAVTLGGTDPDDDALTFSVLAPPAHGDLSGTAPALTYTPDAGYSGPDSFTFTASDGSLSDTGTITLDVSEQATTAPGSPVITGTTVAEGEATVSWTPPSTDGGSAITGYVVTVPGGPGPLELAADARSATVYGLPNGTTSTIEVAARNAVGTGPAASTTATPQWWLPWSSGPVAVNQIFTWMTGASPTSAQSTTWLAQLDAGSKLPGDLVVALRGGPDATGNVDPVVRLYSAYLVRIPDASGLNFWLGRRRAGWTLSRISANFAGSSEFTRRYGSLTNRQFVEQIYLNVLGRPGEASGVNFWTGQLDAKKKSRGQVMINFSESNEYKTKQVNKVHAAVVYIHLRGKTPTTGERDAFVQALVDGTPLRDLVREQIHLPAFDTRAG